MSNTRQPPRLPVSPLAVGQTPLLKRFARRGKTELLTQDASPPLIVTGKLHIPIAPIRMGIQEFPRMILL